MTRNRFGILHQGFLLITGLLGWLALVAVTWWRPGLFRPWEVSWEFLACMALALVGRLLSFYVFEGVRIALDSAFYIASTFVFGVVPGAWLVLLTISVDRVVEAVRAHLANRGASLWTHALEVVHAGGLPVLVMLPLGIGFGVDEHVVRSDVTLAWLIPLFTVCFLAVFYFIAGGSSWLRGTPPIELLRGYFVKVLFAELSLVPLALAMVLGYAHQGKPLFFLLGAIGLMFNVVYRRMVNLTAKLKARVQELSTLNEVGRIIAASLERPALITNIATATLRLVGHTSRFLIAIKDDKSDKIKVDIFDETGANRRMEADPNDGLSGWVMKNRQPLLLGDTHGVYTKYSQTDKYFDPRFHSWMGVPLITYDEVIGVVSLQSELRNAYTQDHLRVLRTIADEAAVALENARLYELATVDGLTGLFVRRYFDQRLQEEWKRSERYVNPFAVGLLDLDNFKALNDTHGHQAGDAVLRAAAQVVRKNMRGADLAGRYGGEEFAFILPRTGVSEAAMVAQRIRADLETIRVSTGDKILSVTASIGVAGFPESGAANVEELVTMADAALYDAKSRGKNRVVVYERPTDAARHAAT